jgi:hypothetical protein
MANVVTLKQVEQLAGQLPPQQQLRLVNDLSRRLGVAVRKSRDRKGPRKQGRAQREAAADALLSELDAIAESISGEFDSAADIRRIRDED